jgi:hypothetical protein
LTSVECCQVLVLLGLLNERGGDHLILFYVLLAVVLATVGSVLEIRRQLTLNSCWQTLLLVLVWSFPNFVCGACCPRGCRDPCLDAHTRRQGKNFRRMDTRRVLPSPKNSAADAGALQRRPAQQAGAHDADDGAAALPQQVRAEGQSVAVELPARASAKYAAD